MKLINACFIAFATYSRIPVPQVEWNERNMKYSFCFFPLIGAFVGAALLVLDWVCGFFGFGRTLFAAAAAALPALLTGGIHMDGFCDTSDALASHAPRERKLEILKDSNVGAFAVIRLCLFYLLYFGALSQISSRGLGVAAAGFVLSRALSGFAVVRFRAAKKDGMAAAFRDAAHRSTVSAVMAAFAALAAGAMVWAAPVAGACALMAALAVFAYYRVMSYRVFGGVTGDLAGWFLSLCELWIVWGAVMGEGVARLWI
ncbi:MAG: adenosylcobinamide-GDP ribazoletransferase [Clostridium sp. SCN 57-10]|nr:MAG: adenosylcobinamide-GDP ribazoletransferase [Clostridium sp. SCN 57-10]